MALAGLVGKGAAAIRAALDAAGAVQRRRLQDPDQRSVRIPGVVGIGPVVRAEHVGIPRENHHPADPVFREELGDLLALGRKPAPHVASCALGCDPRDAADPENHLTGRFGC